MRKQKKIRMLHIFIILMTILLSLNSWKHIPKLYKNMMYGTSFNVLYYLLCKRHLVWEFNPAGIPWKVIRLLYVGVVTPLLILTFLSRYPQTLMKQIIYTIQWVFVASVFEYLAHKQKIIQYAHGWNGLWSGVIYTLMFTFSNLFTIKPVLTLFLSMYSTLYFIIKFKVPIRRKHLSSQFDPLLDLYYHSFLKDLVDQLKKSVTYLI